MIRKIKEKHHKTPAKLHHWVVQILSAVAICSDVADRTGFEPARVLRLNTLSRRAP